MEKVLNGNNGEEKQEIDIDEWVLITVVSGSKLFGRLGETHHVIVDFGNIPDRKERALQVIMHDGLLELDPGYYFKDDPMFINGPQGPGVQRTPLALPLGFTLHPTKVYAKAIEIMFCSDLNPKDKSDYEMFARQVEATMTNARMQKSGLVGADASALQGLPRFPGGRR